MIAPRGVNPRPGAGRGPPGHAGRPRPNTRGIILHVALGIVVLAGLFALTYFAFVRGQTRLTQGALAGEVAYHLAQGGVSAAIGAFTNTQTPTRLYEALVTRTPEEINGLSDRMGPESLPLDLLARKVRGDASVKVEMTLSGFARFPRPDPESGIQEDPVEKHGTLRITSTASFMGTSRRVVAFKEVRVVNVLPPVVSKFTLFVKNRIPAASLNGIRWAKGDLSSGAPAPGNVHAPLFLRNGPARNPEESGWVFLGGGAHHLNLTWGATGWGDQFLLLRNPWQVTADPSSPLALGAGHAALLMQRGVFSGIKTDNDLFTHYDFDQPPGDPVGEEAALLRPYGPSPTASIDPDLDVSPTYVLGQVYRRFLNFRYIRQLAIGRVAYCPYSRAADWAAPPPQPWSRPPPFEVKVGVFGSSYALYTGYMSTVVEESVNRGLDFLSEPQELDPGARLLNTVRVRHSMGLPDFLYDPRVNTGHVAIRTADGRKLFDGHLHRILPRDLRVSERAVFSADASRFPRWLARPPRRIPGIVHFTGGDLLIDRPLDLESGGVLAADGSIVIGAGVQVKPYGRPLSLVSLSGNIVLRTGAPVEAALVALSGTLVRETGRPVAVRGCVAVEHLDLAAVCKAPTHGKIIYDARLDPTAATDPRGPAYAAMLSPWRTHYLPPVE